MESIEQKVDTEERIFEAAIQVFSQKGKDGARMQEIADEAGINKSMLHYYFRSKEKLYEAVFQYVFREFSKNHLASIVEAPTFAETLRSFIYAFIDNHQKKPAIIRLMANENINGGSTMGRIISQNEHDSSPPAIMLKKIAEAVERGEIRPVHPQHTLLTILSCCIFFFLWAPTIKAKIPQAQNWDAFVEARKEHIFEMLYHGLTGSTTEG